MVKAEAAIASDASSSAAKPPGHSKRLYGHTRTTIMPGHDIIVIGASAGGVEAILRLAAQLPPDLPAAVFVVVHISPLVRSLLPLLLDKRGALPAAHAIDGETIVTGRI